MNFEEFYQDQQNATEKDARATIEVRFTPEEIDVLTLILGRIGGSPDGPREHADSAVAKIGPHSASWSKSDASETLMSRWRLEGIEADGNIRLNGPAYRRPEPEAEDIDPEEVFSNRVEELFGLTDASAVAEFLIDAGVKGYKEDAHDCPLSRYLSKDLPNGYSVSVDEGDFDLLIKAPYDRDRFGSDVTCIRSVKGYEEIPSHLAQFIKQFDAGEWPDLNADEEEG